MRIKVTALDRLFSRYIRTRDNWRCVSCGKMPKKQGLDASHFWTRGRVMTRYDPRNVDALCMGCHRKWGGDYRHEYVAFKLKQLGPAVFNHLEICAHSTGKPDLKLIQIWLKNELKSMDDGVYGKAEI